MDLRGVFAACHVTPRHKQTHSAKCNDTSKRRFQKKTQALGFGFAQLVSQGASLALHHHESLCGLRLFDVPRTCCGIQDRREKKNTSDSNYTYGLNTQELNHWQKYNQLFLTEHLSITLNQGTSKSSSHPFLTWTTLERQNHPRHPQKSSTFRADQHKRI